jgi:hypothetical protein
VFVVFLLLVVLLQLAQINTQVSATRATKDLQDWLSQVVFQAQSAKTPIQILGSFLEQLSQNLFVEFGV